MTAPGRKRPLKIAISCLSERPLSGKADIQVLSVLAVSPQRLWAKDTESFAKRRFEVLVSKGCSVSKRRCKGVVPVRHFPAYKLLICKVCAANSFAVVFLPTASGHKCSM